MPKQTETTNIKELVCKLQKLNGEDEEVFVKKASALIRKFLKENPNV